MKFWQQLLAKLEENQQVYVLTVIQNSGSSPGRKGFKMLVAQDGFIFGSVGGGVMEFSLVSEAQALLKQEKSVVFLKKQIHQGNVKDSSGMICSGEQTVVFHSLTNTAIPQVKNILSCLQNKKKSILRLTPNSLEFLEVSLPTKLNIQITDAKNWLYEEQIGFTNTLYIFGGGHIGLAVSELFSKLDFRIVIFDNREGLNTLEKNSFADEKKVINYETVAQYVEEGAASYVAIMTHKCADDKLILEQLMKNKYSFIGVLGSRAKLNMMWTVLRDEGITQDELDRVFAPIGLPIRSQTPEEIAVSVAAQIIQVKNKKL